MKPSPARFAARKTGDKQSASLVGVVDDNAMFRKSLFSLIRSAGYQCSAFPSAEEFLKSGAVGKTDCMVLDVQMPGLSGLQLQLKLRKMHDTAPVIFVTGNVDERLRNGAMRQGATAVFEKPFNQNDLLGAIRSAIKEHRRAGRAGN